MLLGLKWCGPGKKEQGWKWRNNTIEPFGGSFSTFYKYIASCLFAHDNLKLTTVRRKTTRPKKRVFPIRLLCGFTTLCFCVRAWALRQSRSQCWGWWSAMVERGEPIWSNQYQREPMTLGRRVRTGGLNTLGGWFPVNMVEQHMTLLFGRRMMMKLIWN